MSISGRDGATGNRESIPQDGANEALVLMERALGLLDDAKGPDDIGAHLDLAIHRLKDWLAGDRS